MKIALCAIAKCENDYVDEWVRHHIDLGFDRIFLYDNNDPDYEYVGDRISEEYRDKVEIISILGVIDEHRQEDSYSDCYRKHSLEFDWIAFFDVDEFLVLNCQETIKEKLELIQAENVLIPWKVYTWSGRFSRDLSGSVMEDFTESTTYNNHVVKSIVKTNLPNILSAGINNHRVIAANSWSDIDGNSCGEREDIGVGVKAFRNGNGSRTAVLNHYWSKSLDEFIRFKCTRRYPDNNQPHFIEKALGIFKYSKFEDRETIKAYLKEYSLFKDEGINFDEIIV